MTPQKLTHLLATAIFLTTPHLHAQFDMEESHTTASLRGIHNVGGGVAWASGTNGTVLRTEDGGYLWQPCTTPPGAEKLDFRGIQAWDENTAIVMSIGKGDQSRLYKTTDGCQTWKLLFTNPDPEGFWDYLHFIDRNNGIVIGDPAVGFAGDFSLRIRITHNGGQTWAPVVDPETASPGKNLMPLDKEGLFAASNSSASLVDGWLWMGTGHGRILRRRLYDNPANRAMAFQQITACAGAMEIASHSCGIPWTDWTVTNKTPLTAPGDTSGVFSIHFRNIATGIAVGGDYQKPDADTFNATWTTDSGTTWNAAKTPPHGYRSSVAYDPTQKFWITTGPNGTDISTDDGKNWRPLKPSGYDAPGTDKDWNALSLPFVVGPKGRIGRLRTIPPEALK